MTAQKRGRDSLLTSDSSQRAAQALLGLSREPLKKCKIEANESDKSSPELQLPFEHRQALFRAALHSAGQVVDSIWGCSLQAGNTKNAESNLDSSVVLNQLCAIQSFYCLIVAELGKMCNILTENVEAIQVKMMKVIIEEIKRLGSPKTACELLRLLTRQIDLVLSNIGMQALIGSVEKSLTRTFAMIRSLVHKNEHTGKFEVVKTVKSAKKDHISEKASLASSSVIKGYSTNAKERSRACGFAVKASA